MGFKLYIPYLQTLITLGDDNTLTQKQDWDGKSTTITRKVADGKLVVVSGIESHFVQNCKS